MSGKREQAWRFCQAVRHATTLRALAAVLDVNENWVRSNTPGMSRRGRSKVSRAVLARMWKEWRAGQTPRLYKDVDAAGEQWTQPQISHLLDETGKRRFALVCDGLQRTQDAAREMLRRLRRQGRIHRRLEFTVCQLAAALDRTPSWVRALVDNFSLRAYTDLRGTMIHREDAWWLLDWWDGKSAIPKHPGKDDGS